MPNFLSLKAGLAGLACAATLAFSATNAHAHGVPACDDASILSKVHKQLSIGERNVVKSGDPILTLDYPRQTKLRENGPRAEAQRYCRATGITEHGRKKRVYYIIEEHAGFIGLNYGVEACILGRDPWRIHGASCRSVR